MRYCYQEFQQEFISLKELRHVPENSMSNKRIKHLGGRRVHNTPLSYKVEHSIVLNARIDEREYVIITYLVLKNSAICGQNR